MTSGSSVDSTRVNEALLAVKSQRVRYSRRTRNDLPVSSGPPTKRSERVYGDARRRRRRGRTKVEAKNISQTGKVETTYLERMRIAQPRGNAPEHCHRVRRPKHRRGRIKSESIKVKTA